MRLTLCLSLMLAVAGCVLPEERLEVTEQPLKGGTDVTFLVCGDTHFGADGMGALNRRMVEAMNRLPGTPYPAAVGGTVAEPRGVLHLGDVTETGLLWQWSEFEQVFGLTGKEGILKFPVFECTGNHDRMIPWNPTVTLAVAMRHGGLPYSWDWDDLHLVCLDIYPTADNVRWLRRDLAAVGHARPVVIYFHYTLQGFLSEMWSPIQKNAFAKAIEGFNVVALLTGHWHVAGHELWRGHELFRPGSPKHDWHQFLVVHITDRQMTVGFWNWDLPDSAPPEKHWSGPAIVRPINQAGLATPAPASR